MIIIIGSTISEDKLPSFSEYKIIATAAEAKMTLRLTTNPTAVFVNESIAKDLNTPLISKDIRENFIYFSNDNELLKKVSGISDDDSAKSSKSDESVVESRRPTGKEVVTTKVQQSTVNDVPNISSTAKDGVKSQLEKVVKSGPKVEPKVGSKVESDVVPTVKSKVEKLEFAKETKVETVSDDDIITEIDDDYISDTFKIPISENGSYDAMAAKLKAKEEQLVQLQQMFADKTDEFNRMLTEQDESTAQIIKTYENKLMEASTAFNKLKSDYTSVLATTGKYHVYAEKSKAVLKEGFAPQEKEFIQSLNLDLRLMCTVGDVTDMHFMMRQNIDTFKENYVFVDFTGSHFFDLMYHSNIGGALKLFSEIPDSDVESMKSSFYSTENATILADYNFHDIMFLDANWTVFFNNLKKLFGDRKIILLFNSISSFSVLYTLSKLATIFKAYVHLRCSYFSIQGAYTRLRLVPQSRGIKLVATYYFDEVKDIITEVGKNYEIKTSTDILSLSTIENRV